MAFLGKHLSAVEMPVVPWDLPGGGRQRSTEDDTAGGTSGPSQPATALSDFTNPLPLLHVPPSHQPWGPSAQVALSWAPGPPLQGSLSRPRLEQCAGLVHQDPGRRWVTLSPRAAWVLTKYSLGMDGIISEDT